MVTSHLPIRADGIFSGGHTDKFPGFIGPSYTARSMNVDARRCVNLFPELDELGTGAEHEIAALVGSPGLIKLSTAGLGPCRGLYYSSVGRSFMVSGATLYEVTAPVTPIPMGTLVTGLGSILMTDNGVDLVLADGVKGYTFRFATNMFNPIGDPDFPAGANVAQFLDQ